VIAYLKPWSPDNLFIFIEDIFMAKNEMWPFIENKKQQRWLWYA
jgi:hypothetical protein